MCGKKQSKFNAIGSSEMPLTHYPEQGYTVNDFCRS